MTATWKETLKGKMPPALAEEIDVFEHDGVAVGNALGPLFAAGGGDGGGDEAEVAAFVVGADVEQTTAMIDVVLVLVFARGD